MKRGRLVAGIGIGLLLWTLLRRSASSLAGQFNVGRITARWRGIQNAIANIDIQLDINNATSVTIPFDGLVGQLMYEGVPIGNIQISQPFSLDGGATTTVVAPVSVPLAQLGNSLLAVLQGGTLRVGTLTVSGSARIKGVNVPFSQNVSLL